LFQRKTEVMGKKIINTTLLTSPLQKGFLTSGPSYVPEQDDGQAKKEDLGELRANKRLLSRKKREFPHQIKGDRGAKGQGTYDAEGKKKAGN